MADPVILVRDFTGHIMNQVAIDTESKRSTITMSAMIFIAEAPDGTACRQAEAFSLMKLPDISRERTATYADRFIQELRDRRVKRVIGWVQPTMVGALERYGFHPGGEVRPSPLGELALVARWLP